MSDSPPWMPLNVGDYLKDTGHLTVSEHGAYMLLAMRLWRTGDLPAPEIIHRYARLSATQWAESGERILELFQRDSTGYSSFERMIGAHRKRSIPRSLRRLVFDRDGRRCVYCGDTDGPFQIDHRFPWSRGGRHEIDNLCVACLRCNAEKGALTAEEFAEVLG